MIWNFRNTLTSNAGVVMSVFSLLSFFGCKAGNPQEANMVQHGNFVIKRELLSEKSSGKVLGREYKTASFLIKYQIFFKNRQIKFPAALTDGHPYNFPWRVFILAEAPVPALIAGSHNLFLVKEGKAGWQIEKLNPILSPYGTLQWLDAENGLPGTERQIHDPQNEDLMDSSLVLGGGRFLLINRFTVLDIRTLETYAFNPNDIRNYNEWLLALESASGFHAAVGFSSVHKQVVFRALKIDKVNEGNYFPALLSFHYATGTPAVVPFSRGEFRLRSLDDIDPIWVKQYFEWDSTGMLRRVHDVVLPPWQGQVNFPDKPIINYEIQPVKPSMIKVFIRFLSTTSINHESAATNFSATDHSVAQSTQQVLKVIIDQKAFALTYDKKEMKLTFDRDFMTPHSEEYREIIMSIGKQFNAELRQGKHDAHFGEFAANTSTGD